MSARIEIRREPRPGDADRIIAHHEAVYPPEYGVDAEFVRHVAASVHAAEASGWPRERERVWIVEADGRHAGSLALTDEGEGTGVVRWFVIDAELRGTGIGGRMAGELVAEARAAGYERLVLETFSDLRTAAHIYRSHGFELVSSDPTPRWGRDDLTYQRYEVKLAPSADPDAAASRTAPPESSGRPGILAA